ncbi:hypothetical protein GIB67_019076 [Kingdonia uniflora]|uniref:Uncharacterized protein n=1 Tax=Kingdonia uniflora TaxID=39325 RepID=A0A7J7MZP0_9MAGN|nr:hypothetical protein GIB67_019076 [Kingdonia uniflora]
MRFKCKQPKDHEVCLEDNGVEKEDNGDEAVFVAGTSTFIITDDLQIMLMPTATSLALMKNLDVMDMKALEEMIFDVSLEQPLVIEEMQTTIIAIQISKCISFLNLKSSTSTTGRGYMTGPVTFMVTDDLVVTDLSPISLFSFLESQNVLVYDIEEHMVSMGTTEVIYDCIIHIFLNC